MTTTNNLIDQVGGIEKAKEIVGGAPETSTLVFYFFDEINNELIGPEYYRDNGSQHFNKLRKSWGFCLDPQIRVTKPHDSLIGINNLRTAIAQHEQGSNSSEFKVGDLVVDSTGFFDWLCKVDYLSSDGRVVMYKHDKSKNDTAYQTWPNIESVRHATPSEIKAGRRLDHSVDVTDMVTDITNHISPRTIVWDLASGEDWSVNHG